MPQVNIYSGEGFDQVAESILFGRGADGRWTATWTHLYLPGSPRFNQSEGNRVSTGLLVRAIAERPYLTVGHLVDLLARAGTEVSTWQPGRPLPQQPVTFLGLHRPDELPAGSTAITVDRLNELIPD